MLKKNNFRRYRVPVSSPVNVKHGDRSVPAVLKDVSLGGAFFFTETALEPGANIQIVLMLPREVGLPDDQIVCCHGKIVRVEQNAGKFGVAAQFERMERLPQI